MAVSKHIIDLVRLALADRVLTFTERKTIVKEALDEGVTDDEINQYLDNALKERLKSYTKEELKCCPACGAQIPLISDQCLFCGVMLEQTVDEVRPSAAVSGKAADIIRAENLKTTKNEGLENCPDCGAPFPLVSNICTHCGHVLHERVDSELNVKNLINNIQQNIDELKSAPQPTFWQVLWYRKNFWVFLVATMLMIMFMRYLFRYVNSGYMLLTLFLSSFVLWVVSLIMTKANKKAPPSKTADDKFFTALHRKEMFESQISTLYGDNPEAKKVLQQYTALTDSVKAERHARQIKVAALIVAFVVGNLFMMLDTFSNKDVFRLDTQKFSEIYAFWDKKFAVVPDTLAPDEYIIAEGTADLSYDLLFDNYINSVFGDKIDVRLRLSNINLKSTGKESDSRRGISIELLDQNGNRVGEEFGPLCLPFVNIDNSPTYLGSFYNKLESGHGECTAEFVSAQMLKMTADKQTAELLTQTAQNAKFFKIIYADQTEQ